MPKRLFCGEARDYRADYDFLVDLHFLFTGRFPLALRDSIRLDKLSIYQGLGPDIGRAEMLTGYRVYTLDGRNFGVSFASDTLRDDHVLNVRQLRVLQIDELS